MNRRSEAGISRRRISSVALTSVLACGSLWFSSAPLEAVAETVESDLLISGRVVTATGSPIADVSLRLVPAESAAERGRHWLEMGVDPEPLASAVTDDMGRYALPVPTVGIYRIEAEIEGRMPAERARLLCTAAQDLGDLTLPQIRWRSVVVDGLTADELSRATVTFHSRSSRSLLDSAGWSIVPRRARLDSTGTARLPAAPKEKVELWIDSPGHAPFQQSIDTREESRARLRQGRSVQLQTRAPGDRPIGHAVVLAEHDRPIGITDAEGGLVRQFGSDATDLFADAFDGRRGHGTVGPEDKSIRILLREPTRLTGRVLQAGSRRPMPGALVWLRGERPTLTDASGAYRLELPSDATGNAFLLAAAPRHARAWQKLPLGSGDGPTLLLEPGASIVGKVRDERGRPVAGAVVTLDPPNDSRELYNAYSKFLRSSSRTDGRGRFKLEPVPVDLPLTVHVRTSELGPATANVDALGPLQTSAKVPIVLHAAQVAFGTVVDDAGEPIVGAEVDAEVEPSQMSFYGRDGTKPSAATDPSGRFELRGFDPATYRLRILAPGFAPLRDQEFRVGERVHGAGQPIDLGQFTLVPGERISGRAMTVGGLPAAGAEIQLSQDHSTGRMSFRYGNSQHGQPAAIVDAEGRFELDSLAVGETLIIEATLEGYVPATLTGVEVPLEAPLELLLEPEASISGKLLTSDGEPIAGANLELSVAGKGSRFGNWGEHGSSDPDGSFEFSDLRAGTYLLTVDSPMWASTSIGDLEVATGESIDNLEITLTAGATVVGKVTGPDGRPIAEVMVSMLDDNNRSRGGPRSVTDGDGRFELGGVELGPQMFETVSQELGAQRRELEVARGANRLDINYPYGQAVAGTVLSEFGEPIARAIVTLTAKGARYSDERSDFSSGDGSFGFDGVPSGDYRLSAKLEPLAEATLEFQIEDGSAPPLELVMTSGVRVTGNLIGLEPSKFATATVGAYKREHYTQKESDVTPDGRFEIAGLSPGVWILYAEHGERTAHDELVVDSSTSTVEVDLEFSTDGYTLTGQILDSGAPFLSGRVRLSSSTGGSSGTGATDRFGRFEIIGLAAGAYQLDVLDGRYTHRHTVEVELTSDRDLAIELTGAGVAGSVRDAFDGRPIEGAAVLLSPAEETESSWVRQRRGVSDSAGSFRLEGLQPTDYIVRAEKQGYATAESSVSLDPSDQIDSLNLELEPTEGLTLRLATASGAVPRQVSVAALSGPRQVVHHETATVTSDGTARLSSLPAGAYQLIVSSYATGPSTVEVRAPGPTVTVRLPREAVLELNLPGLDDVYATVELFDETGSKLVVPGGFSGLKENWHLYTSSSSIGGLPAGSFRAEVTHGDRSWAEQVQLSEGQLTSITLR